MRIRHLNRGDVKDGGCTMCKPRHKRYESLVPMPYLIEEGLEEHESEIEEATHPEVGSWA